MALLGASPVFAQSSWNVLTGGNWDTAANWTTDPTIPNAIGATANITNLTAAGTYVIDASSTQNFTVGTLNIGTATSANAVVLSTSANVGLIFDVASGSAQLNAGTTASGVTLNSPIQLNDNLTFTNTRNGGSQPGVTIAGSVNLQGNTWSLGNMVQGLNFSGVISGTGAVNTTFSHGSSRATNFQNSNSTYSGGTTVGRFNNLTLGTSGAFFTGSGSAGLLGTGTITVTSSTTNDLNAATIQGNGQFLTGITDSTNNILANNIAVGSGQFLVLNGSREFNYNGLLSGSGTILKTVGVNNGTRAVFFNTANATGFTGAIEIQDGQIAARVNDAISNTATIRFNPTSNVNGAGLIGSTASGTNVSIGSTLEFQRTASGNSQFITTSGGSTLTLSGNFSETGSGTSGYIGLGRGNGTLTNAGGGYATGTNSGVATIALTGTGTLSNNIGIVNGTSATSVLSLGNTSGTQTFSGIVSGNGSLVRNGVGGTTILSGVNTFSGTTTVTAGTLLVNGTHGAAGTVGSYTVNGGTLGGTGAIRAGSAALAAVTVSSGGMISAGDAGIGTLTLDGANTTGAILNMGTGTSFSFDLGAANSSDLVRFFNYSGAGDFVRTGTVTLNFTGAQNGTYTLFSFFSDTGTSVVASSISSGLTLGTGLSGFTSTLNYNTNDISLTLSAIPEPSTYAALAGLGVLGLAALRRRRSV